jgi:hypothetical protein
MYLRDFVFLHFKIWPLYSKPVANGYRPKIEYVKRKQEKETQSHGDAEKK